jgi:predicted nucleic acid-binding protein
MSYLLDTNVISEIRRGRDRNVAAWAGEVTDPELHLSVLTLGEIRKGIERLRRRDPKQAEVFTTWLEELRSRFADRILPVDARVADQWGRLNAPAERKAIDSLIAATALVHRLTVATRNTADFLDCGVPLLNPWQRRRHRPSGQPGG